jgi:hypothetical protein
MKPTHTLRITAGAALLALGLITGCKSDQQKALDQAKAQASATNTPQQVQYVDGDGNTVATTVQPPPAAGQPEQITTSSTPPPPGPKPAKTKPVVIALGSPLPGSTPDQQTAAANQTSTTTSTTTTNNGQPASTSAPVVNLSVPAGTELAIRINQNISVKHSHEGDHFSGEVVESVVHDGVNIVPRGTPVRGVVAYAHRRGHFKGASILELRLTSLDINGQAYNINTHDNVHTKKGKGKRTAGWIGGMTGAGMLIGGIASGGVGLAIGAAAGAGSGTLIAGATGNRDIDIPAESIQHFRLSDDLVVQAQ